MSRKIYFVFVLLSLISCQAKNQKVKSSNDTDIIPIKVKDNLTELQEAYFKIPENLVNLKECLDSDSKNARNRMITEKFDNLIIFSEACNGSTCEFAKLNNSPLYFLGVCKGGPGCDQRVYLFRGKEMKPISSAFEQSQIDDFLKANPLIKKRLSIVHEEIDLSESLMLSFNKDTDKLELIPSIEFAEERIPVGTANFANNKLLLQL